MNEFLSSAFLDRTNVAVENLPITSAPEDFEEEEEHVSYMFLKLKKHTPATAEDASSQDGDQLKLRSLPLWHAVRDITVCHAGKPRYRRE